VPNNFRRRIKRWIKGFVVERPQHLFAATRFDFRTVRIALESPMMPDGQDGSGPDAMNASCTLYDPRCTVIESRHDDFARIRGIAFAVYRHAVYLV